MYTFQDDSENPTFKIIFDEGLRTVEAWEFSPACNELIDITIPFLTMQKSLHVTVANYRRFEKPIPSWITEKLREISVWQEIAVDRHQAWARSANERSHKEIA